jgi:hypothetical protein
MNADDFRRIALGMADAIEGSHMQHPDFRVNGRIFATLHSGNESGMVTLTPAQQETFVRADPSTFAPESGAWGRAGCTRVSLRSADGDALGEAMTLAWQNAAKKQDAAKKPKSGKKPKTARKTTLR